MSETTPRVPAADPGAGVRARRAEILEAIARVLDRGRFILGDEVSAFESEFAAATGCAAAVGVASGTDAVRLALEGCGVGAGDEVITVSHTAVGTVAAVEMAGGSPVLVDVEPGTMTLDPALLEAAITPRTRAILPVHLYGQPADLTPILRVARDRGITVIEDSAQSHGATLDGRPAGSFGDAAAFSFYPTKNLGALGDGGAVTTSRPDVAERVRLLREYGWRERYVSAITGINSRLDELQAAVLRVRLRHVEAETARRRAIAARYDEAFRGAAVRTPVVRAGVRHAYHQYVIRHSKRDALREFLAARGVGTLIHYPVPVHRQPAYAGRLRVVARPGAAPGALPESESAAAEVVSLPVHPELTDDQVAAVVAAVRDGAAACA